MEISRGIIPGAQKIIVFGPEGIGKTYFVSKFPNPVFIDTEGSTRHMDVARTPKPTSWTMLMEQIQYFKNNPTLCDTLVIDTADWAEQLCITQICDTANKKGIEDFGYGKGYTYLMEEFGRLLNSLQELVEKGINVVLVAHAAMRKFEQPDEMGAYDRWELKLQKKTAPLVKEWADMVLFANYKTYVIDADGQGTQKGVNKVQGGKRIMYTSHHPCWDAKNRHDLKEELPLDYDQIAHCILTRDGSGPAPAPKTESAPVPETDDKLLDELLGKTPPPEPPKESKPTKQNQKSGTQADWSDVARQTETIPKALQDLMKPENVTIEEIQKAVASKGYYPESTPIDKYDPNFVKGVLIGAWPQVFGMIKEQREIDEPF